MIVIYQQPDLQFVPLKASYHLVLQHSLSNIIPHFVTKIMLDRAKNHCLCDVKWEIWCWHTLWLKTGQGGDLFLCIYIQKDKSRPVKVKWITFKVIYLTGANKKQHLLHIAKEAFTISGPNCFSFIWMHQTGCIAPYWRIYGWLLEG